MPDFILRAKTAEIPRFRPNVYRANQVLLCAVVLFSSVCPSVCHKSQVPPKWLNVGSRKERCMIAYWLCFLLSEVVAKYDDGHPTEAPRFYQIPTHIARRTVPLYLFCRLKVYSSMPDFIGEGVGIGVPKVQKKAEEAQLYRRETETTRRTMWVELMSTAALLLHEKSHIERPATGAWHWRSLKVMGVATNPYNIYNIQQRQNQQVNRRHIKITYLLTAPEPTRAPNQQCQSTEGTLKTKLEYFGKQSLSHTR